MDFLTALKKRKEEGRIPVIPDIKCFSPKDGDLMRGRDPVRIAKELEAAGACALSVVTEEKEFHGSLELLRTVCRAVEIPVLRKDFLETEEDLAATKEAGASAVLLMYACLGREKLEKMYHAAFRMGLVPFVETHTKEELEWAAELGAPLVGINNRDILALERDDGDVSHAEDLLTAAPKDAFLVAESALTCGRDVRRALKAGADAALVGTAVLSAPDPVKMYRSLARPCGIKICGVMDEEGIDLCLDNLADEIGFVTEYPVNVPWNMPETRTAHLLEHVKAARSVFAKTCIVTGGSPEKVISLGRRLKPDAVQLHGSETLEETALCAGELLKDGIRVIRSIPQDPVQRMRMFGTEDLQEIITMLEDTAVDTVLLDSRDQENAGAGGGSILAGKKLSGDLKCGRPLMVGGGITAGTIKEVLRCFRPDCIDIMTGSETAPGKKSKERIEGIVRAVEQ